jgi:UDP-N-acetyl-D-mannosaminuronate dehydrogenase
MAASGYRVIGYDPLANELSRIELKDKAVILEDISTCLEHADAVVITTPDPEFRALQLADFPQKKPPILVYDCWRILREKLQGSPNIRYIPLGMGIEDGENAEKLKKLWSEPEEL